MRVTASAEGRTSLSTSYLSWSITAAVSWPDNRSSGHARKTGRRGFVPENFSARRTISGILYEASIDQCHFTIGAVIELMWSTASNPS